ncbi:MAG: hypothetical protein R6T98_06335 [Desulfatiglandales bacterium]
MRIEQELTIPYIVKYSHFFVPYHYQFLLFNPDYAVGIVTRVEKP